MSGSEQRPAAAASADGTLGQLSGEQRMVIEWMTAGQTAMAAATAAGVARSTVYRWMKADPNFLAAYNQWQSDVLATAKARLVAATDVAVSAVVGSMAKGDAKTAMALLKQLGLLKSPAAGPIDPELIAQSQRDDRHREMMQAMEDHEDALAGLPRKQR